jgi:thiol-disulfide isomerase/thioredoxin
MKKLVLILVVNLPLILFSQQSQKDSFFKAASDYIKLKRFEKSVLEKPEVEDDSTLIKHVLLLATDNYGKNVPDFKATSLTGQTYSAEMLVGKVTFINFWFENCAPCVAEFESLNELYKKFKDKEGFQFISFTFDKQEKALKAVQKYGLQYPVISISADSCRMLINHRRGGFPTNLITDRSGKIVFYINGGPPEPKDAQKWERKIFVPLLEELLYNIN